MIELPLKCFSDGSGRKVGVEPKGGWDLWALETRPNELPCRRRVFSRSGKTDGSGTNTVGELYGMIGALELMVTASIPVCPTHSRASPCPPSPSPPCHPPVDPASSAYRGFSYLEKRAKVLKEHMVGMFQCSSMDLFILEKVFDSSFNLYNCGRNHGMIEARHFHCRESGVTTSGVTTSGGTASGGTASGGTNLNAFPWKKKEILKDLI